MGEEITLSGPGSPALRSDPEYSAFRRSGVAQRSQARSGIETGLDLDITRAGSRLFPDDGQL